MSSGPADKDLRPETRLLINPVNHDPATGGVVPPISPATTYSRDRETYDPSAGLVYVRDDNPSFRPAEVLLSELEGGAEALLFSSGMAAITVLVQSLAPGDTIIVSHSLYFGARKWLEDWARQWGLGVSFVDTTNPAVLAQAIRGTMPRLVYVETPANPDWGVTDIASAAEQCRAVGATLAVDNTSATPVFTRPLDLGADIVVHAATKFLNGHSDVIAGALVTKSEELEIWRRAESLRHDAGAVLGSMDAWLLHRGMKTLFVRVRQASGTAAALAAWADADPRIAGVHYPGLASFPGNAVAARQMIGGFGAMLSLRLGTRERALGLIRNLRLFVPATSLGGVESLIEHRHTIEQGVSDVAEDLLRVSIGLEAEEDLIADLDQALSALE